MAFTDCDVSALMLAKRPFNDEFTCLTMVSTKKFVIIANLPKLEGGIKPRSSLGIRINL